MAAARAAFGFADDLGGMARVEPEVAAPVIDQRQRVDFGVRDGLDLADEEIVIADRERLDDLALQRRDRAVEERQAEHTRLPGGAAERVAIGHDDSSGEAVRKSLLPLAEDVYGVPLAFVDERGDEPAAIERDHDERRLQRHRAQRVHRDAAGLAVPDRGDDGDPRREVAHDLAKQVRVGWHRGESTIAPMPSRILVAEPLAAEGLALLRERHTIDERPGLSRPDLLSAIPDYDALIVRSQVAVDAELIAAGTRLVVIGRAGVGVDNIDLDAATRAGITVVNAPTGNTVAAAEHTLALLFAVARRIAEADASVRAGAWRRHQLTGLEMRGRTLGIVGLGKIGQAIARRAAAFEMQVIGSDPYLTGVQAANHGVELVAFDVLLARADVVTVHVPLTRATEGLIGREAIARMKPGAIALNVARGGIVDEAALAEALRDGRLAGAGIDVFQNEPPVGSPLLDAPNTVLTPHLGASTVEAQVAVAEEVAAQVVDVLEGRSAWSAVNAPLVTPETARALAPFLPLAETLGQFFAQFQRAGVRTLTVEPAGEIAAFEAAPLTAAVLRGLLETTTTERVNLVNAGALARARGLTVVERRTPEAGSFASLLTVAGDGGTTVAGTIATNGEPRIVRIDDFWLDMAPSAVMLITRHRDEPGTMGRIGTMLGDAGVNIAAVHLARTGPRQDALMILALDDEVPPHIRDDIRRHPAVLDLWSIRLRS